MVPDWTKDGGYEDTEDGCMTRQYTFWGILGLVVLLLGVGSGLEAAAKKRGQQPVSEPQEQRGLQPASDVGSTNVGSERRLALVIGNAAYAEARLKNPVNDATDMAAALKRLGFSVIVRTDADLRTMHDAAEDFSRQLRRSEVGLFYFAGHGIQVNGENYLVPIGSRINREQDVQHETYHVGRLLGIMEEAGNALNLILLDACRNNPFKQSFRSASRGGLAPPKTSLPDSLVSYATSPDSVAADGEGRNGVYTKNLLRYMQTPGLSVEDMFKQVRVSVLQETGQQQRPWELSSLTRSFSFAGGTGAPPSSSPVLFEPRPQVPEKAPVVAANPPQFAPPPPPQRPPAQSAPVSSSAKAGKTLVNSLNMEFVLIPPGEFTMGAEGTIGIPPHRVVISRPFYMGKHEVTQGQWVAIMGTNPSNFKKGQKISSLGKEVELDPDRPVDSVSWNEAQTFIQKLNAQEGHTTYRLPTEAEWEYAARAGASSSAGSGALEQHAWCAANAKGTTHPVGRLQPNNWGLHDMAGNVWEWVGDWWAAYKSDSLTDPTGPPSGVLKVFRGGAWNQPPTACQPAHRYYDAPTFKFPSVGFRLAREAR